MKRKTVAKVVAPVLGLAILLGAGFNTPVQANADMNTPQKVIVVYKNASGQKAVLSQSQTVTKQYKNLPAVSATMTQQGIDNLANNPNVAYIEPDAKVKIADSQLTPVKASSLTHGGKTTYTSSGEVQWDVQADKAPTAWQAGYTGKGVKVGIIDTGIAPHPDLNIAGGVSFVDYTTSYTDDNGHGTNIAGIVGAKHDGNGMVGTAPDASLYAVKVLGSDGSGTLDSVINGIDWAITNKMDIINLSLGSTVDSQALHDMIDKAYNSGILVVCASGNDGNTAGTGDNVEYPAKYSSALSISAVDSHLKRAYFSSTGNKIDFSAGGVNVLSTYLNGQYAYGSGTSQATPHVSGLLALLKQQYPTDTSDQLVAILKANALDLGVAGVDNWYGNGLAQYQASSETQLPPTMSKKQYHEIYEKARMYTQLAVKFKSTTYANQALQYINQLPDGTEKTQLLNQVNAVLNPPVASPTSNYPTAPTTTTTAVSKSLAQAQFEWAVAKAKLYVGFAEQYKTTPYINYAQQDINALPACQQKTDLQNRLNTVKSNQPTVASVAWSFLTHK